jgi:hypothetical protein
MNNVAIGAADKLRGEAFGFLRSFIPHDKLQQLFSRIAEDAH